MKPRETNRFKVLSILESHPQKAMRAKDIARVRGNDTAAEMKWITMALSKLLKIGKVRRLERGFYVLPIYVLPIYKAPTIDRCCGATQEQRRSKKRIKVPDFYPENLPREDPRKRGALERRTKR